MATDSPAAMSRDTSSTMVNDRSGLVTSFEMFSAFSTISRFICTWLILGWSTHSLAATERTILVLGDSISAGYGLKVEESWVALLGARIKAQGYGYKVVNASVSGETTSGGIARLPRALSLHKPEIVVIELGANDGLRGIALEVTRANLEKLIRTAQASKARVALLGMRIPPNYGPRYTEGFSAAYGELAREFGTSYVPFLMQDVALKPKLMQADGLHPTAEAQPLLLETAWPAIKSLLTKK